MKVIVDLKTWYAEGNVELGEGQPYEPYLRNEYGQHCCLGFCAMAHGAHQRDILGNADPYDVRFILPSREWMLNPPEEGWRGTSDLAYLAMYLNDAADRSKMDGEDWSKQPLEVRMGNLITIFLEGGD